MGKAKQKKEDATYLSPNLIDLLYEPNLPDIWDEADDVMHLRMAHGLFLLLNPLFQKKYSKLIEMEAYIYPLDMALEEGEILWSEFRKKVPRKLEKEQSALWDKFHAMDDEKWPFDVDLYFLITLLIKANFHMGMQPRIGSILFQDYEADECKQSIERWSKSRYKDTPEELYYRFNIGVDKKVLMAHFEREIDEWQKSFFEKYPEKKSLAYYHLPRKNEPKKRINTHKWDTMKMCFQSYVYRVRGKKRKEIAELLYPGDTGNVDRINKHLKKAKQYIKNAWVNNFPGPTTV